MKRIIAAALAAVMLLALAGCSSGDDTANLVGTWKGELSGSSITGELTAVLGEESAGYFDFSAFTISYTMIFNEDRTYCVTLTEEDARKAAEDLMVIIEDGMVKMFEDQITMYGLDMTVDELLEMSGITMEQLLAEFDTDALVDELTSGTTTEGNYLAEDGKLYTSASLDTQVSKLSYDEYTLSGNTLTLTNYVGTDDAAFDWVYPMVLTRGK